METTTYLRHLQFMLMEFNDKPILYIMHALGTNRWKIGITSNVNNRWYSIQSQSPVDITLYKVFICDSRGTAKKLEYQFMQQNQNRFIKGEWFVCDAGDIIQLEETILGYEYSHYIDRDLYEHERHAINEKRI